MYVCVGVGVGGGGGGSYVGVCEMEVMRKTLNKALQCVYL